MRRRAALAALLLAAGSCVPGHEGSVVVLDETSLPLVDGAFVSAPFPTHDPATGAEVPASPAWIPFPARQQLTVYFRPVASAEPSAFVWASFDPSGFGSVVAPGDVAHVDAIDVTAWVPPGAAPPAATPASSVTLENATEMSYYVRVLVQ